MMCTGYPTFPLLSGKENGGLQEAMPTYLAWNSTWAVWVGQGYMERRRYWFQSRASAECPQAPPAKRMPLLWPLASST